MSREDPAGRTARDPGARRAEIRAYPDGPFLVRGPVAIVDGDGREIDVRRRVVALCRCGRSRRQPLCDGTHTPAGFVCTGTATAGPDAGGPDTVEGKNGTGAG